LAATVLKEGAARSLVVDRTYVDEENVRWVIDYKTSDHVGGNLEVFLNNELDRYREQLETYAHLFRLTESRTVKCGLYFPLLRAWREM
jgi:hypothetical protein